MRCAASALYSSSWPLLRKKRGSARAVCRLVPIRTCPLDRGTRRGRSQSSTINCVNLGRRERHGQAEVKKLSWLLQEHHTAASRSSNISNTGSSIGSCSSRSGSTGADSRCGSRRGCGCDGCSRGWRSCCCSQSSLQLLRHPATSDTCWVLA